MIDFDKLSDEEKEYTMTEYDPRLVEFTEKLAALMEEYGAEFELMEEMMEIV